jgi:SAM-dependent MidA family methyltransferase
LEKGVSGHPFCFDLVEAGAGNGRLSADILRAARGRRDPALYDRTRLHLVEASALARAAQQNTLGDAADRLVSSSPTLPPSFEGVLIANELLDALPVHQVVMRGDGLREVYVESHSHQEGGLDTSEGPPSTPALAAYLAQLGVSLEPGWQTEIGLRAVEWVRHAARCLRRGFIILIDYGHEARELYSSAHAGGTLTSFSRHAMAGQAAGTPGWLVRPGEQDLTAHVDFTSVRSAAEDEGCVALGFLDQTYFLLGLLTGGSGSLSFGSDSPRPSSLGELRHRLALKTLLMPSHLGSTHKVLILGKDVGRPSLRGCSFGQRVT